MLTSLLDGRVMAERSGEQPARVVAMHGWGRNRHDFAGILDGLDALSLDLPGFGASALPDEAWDTRRYADEIATALDPDAPVILVGHSFGGRVATQLAAAHPELVAGLILTGVPLLRAELSGDRPRPKVPLVFGIAKALNAKRLLSDASVDKLRERYGSADYKAAQGVLRDILVKAVNEDYTAQLERLAGTDLPVHLVWGAHDDAAPLPMARHAAEIIGGNAALEVCPDAGHLLDACLHQAVRRAIDAHL